MTIFPSSFGRNFPPPQNHGCDELVRSTGPGRSTSMVPWYPGRGSMPVQTAQNHPKTSTSSPFRPFLHRFLRVQNVHGMPPKQPSHVASRWCPPYQPPQRATESPPARKPSTGASEEGESFATHSDPSAACARHGRAAPPALRGHYTVKPSDGRRRQSRTAHTAPSHAFPSR